jgi:hypothetical protein
MSTARPRTADLGATQRGDAFGGAASPRGAYDYVLPKIEAAAQLNTLHVSTLHVNARYARRASYKAINGRTLLELAAGGGGVRLLLLDLRDEQSFRECRLLDGALRACGGCRVRPPPQRRGGQPAAAAATRPRRQRGG